MNKYTKILEEFFQNIKRFMEKIVNIINIFS